MQGLKLLKITMKNFIITAVLLLFSLTTFAQEAKPAEPVQTEYKKGDVFQGKEGEQITLISQRNFAQGIKAWKTNWLLNGKKSTIYVPVTYLKECKKIENQK